MLFIDHQNRNGLTKFLLFGAILFIFILIYVILRDVKHALMINPVELGLLASLRDSFLLLCVKVVFFGLFLLIYRRENLPKILFFSTVGLLIPLIAFHFWGFQNAAFLHPDPAYIQDLLLDYRGMETLIVAYGHWTYACYYLLEELWATLIMSFLLWAVLNQTFTLKEASLGYPLLGFVFPNLGVLAGGAFISLGIGGNPNTDFEHTMRLCGVVLLGGLMLFVLLSWVIKKLKLTDVPAHDPALPPETLSVKWITRYLFLILVIVTSFGLCSHLVQLLFKSRLKYLGPSPADYIAFIGQYSTYVGFSSLLLFLLTFWMIWKFGWLKSALILPIYVFVTSCLLILCVYFSGEIPQVFWVFVIQSLVFKGLTFLSLTTKEMAYIPLSLTTKARGKAVVDFLFVSIGLWFWTILPYTLHLFPGGQDIEVILLALIGTTILWIISVLYLGKMFKEISEE